MSRIGLAVLFVVVILLSICKIGRNISMQSKIAIYIVLVFIVICRPETMADYTNYITAYDVGGYDAERFEPAWKLLSVLLKFMGSSYMGMIILYACISVFLKWKAILDMGPYIWVSLAIWLSHTFMFHDMVQIRASVTVGFLLWAIKYKCDNKIPLMVLCFALALIFHYSAIAFIALFFFSCKKTYKWIYLLVIPVSYVFALTNHSVMDLIGIGDLGALGEIYNRYEGDEDANIFTLIQTCQCAICVVLWFGIDKLTKISPYVLILLKTYTVGCVLLLLFNSIATVAVRFTELMCATEILLYPFILNILSVKSKVYYRLIPVIIALTLFSISYWNTSYWQLL